MNTRLKIISRVIRPLVVFTCFVLFTPFVLAEEQRAPRTGIGTAPGGMGMAGMAMGEMQKFIDSQAKVGDLLPDIEIFDHLGQPVNVREISKENYSVLVLGCLT